MDVEIIKIPHLGDDRGSLSVVEAGKLIPFEIKRVYYIYGTKEGVERGFHAHKKLRQLAVAVSGSCDMHLDNGKSQETVRLSSPHEGLLINPGTWRVMKNFTPDCVLMVFADAHYDEVDYIRNYDEFLDSVTPTPND